MPAASQITALKPTRIRAVFFDAAGTLIHLRESVGHGYARVSKRHGINLDPAAIDTAFRQVWKAMPPLGSPLGPDADRSEKRWWRSVVDQVFALAAADTANRANSTDNSARDAHFEDLFQSYASPQAWARFPESADVLDALARRDLRLFVLSNFDSRLLPVLDGLNLASYFETIFYSSAIGHAKPSAEIFSHAVGASRLNPAECLHVGDDPSADWAGARQAGLQAFELDRQRNDLRAILNLPGLPDFCD